MKIGLTVAAMIVLGILIVLGTARSGCVDVSATGKDPALVVWLLETTRESSIERAVDRLEQPELTDEMTIAGVVHYQESCVDCHGAPGEEPDEWADGLNPPPPDLAHEDIDPLEAFWVIQNGIRMTGMPAFGPTHDEAEIWTLAALVAELPRITPERYAEMARLAGVEPDEEDERGDDHHR